jgi:TRAP transporter TAXI family solute receptor
MLQDERIDAFFYTVGHPNGSISEATAGRVQVRFVPIEPGSAFWRQHPYFSKAVIPVKYYENAVNDAEVPTIGMPTTLVTSADVADDVVYEVTKIIFDHLGALRAQHPALADLDPAEMLKGSTAPIHPGALRYYREAGLAK